MSFEDAKKAVEAYDGFELLEYTRTDKPIRIRHSCGGEFSIYYNKFLAAPRCRVCDRDGHLNIRTKEDMERDIKALTGDEYSLVGEYNGPHEYLTIRHAVCGKIQKYRPYYFLDGGRCSFCHSGMTYRELASFVKHFTNGEYEIVGKASKNQYNIMNCETGDTVSLSALRILQELRRPTPSMLLPLNQKNEG